VAKPRRRKQREPFGRIRQLPSCRYQAAYIGPDLVLHKAAATFHTIMDARAWLTEERRHIDAGTWIVPARRNRPAEVATLATYAWAWLADRPLKPSTRELYTGLLKHKILPTLGDLPLRDITPLAVRQWHTGMGSELPRRRAHAYSLLRTILAAAVTDERMVSNPAHIRGAGGAKRVHQIKPATLAELETITANMPDRLQLMVLLAAWCALRFGELIEMRRFDIDVKAGKIMISRAAVRVSGELVVGTPKSSAGVRVVSLPPHLLPVVRDHLATFAAWGKDGLLFPAGSGDHLNRTTFFTHWDRARKAAGRPDLRFHDLRHTGVVLAAQTGATLAELMSRLGHSTPAMAMRYQHAAEDRDSEIARLLLEMITRPAR
jgi:integrase